MKNKSTAWQFPKRLQKWLFLLQYSFRQGNLKSKGILINQAGFVLELAFIIFVWQFITNNNKDVVTYLFAGFMISHLGWNSFAGSLAEDIVSGKITTYTQTLTNLPNPKDSFNF